MIRSMFLLILLISCFATVRIGYAAEKLIADYGGHAGFQSATWIGRDLRIFEKHGLDVEIVMITGAARSVAAQVREGPQLRRAQDAGHRAFAPHPRAGSRQELQGREDRSGARKNLYLLIPR